MTRVVLTGIALPLEEPESCLTAVCACRLGVTPDDLGPIHLQRRSLDARNPDRIRRVYTLEIDAPVAPARIASIPGASIAEPESPREILPGNRPLHGRPVVVGAGPAGLFAAWRLAELGHRPILVERGRPVERRRRDTGRFWRDGVFDPDSNVLFGEGGAGAFSDGKLTTRIKDPRRHDVLRVLAECGADESIRWDARPHIGTDRLYYVLRALRSLLISRGVDVRFEAKVDDLRLADGVTGIETSDGAIETNAVILAIGHSARDTYAMLRERGVAMEAKAFAVGLRVQHRQEVIDRAQYGRAAGNPALDAAEYVLTCKTTRVGRAVYSFCVCPGGTVIPCASEPGALFCNGMSGRSRSGRLANGAIVAQVPPADLPSDDPLGGVAYQLAMERAAFAATGGTYALPLMALADFVRDRTPQTSPERLAVRRFPRAEIVDLRALLPAGVVGAIREACGRFARTIPGWIAEDAVAFGVETRTSAPVRLVRRPDGQSVSTPGLFPCGEGAGYAGGIVSAAVDGIRAAESLVAVYRTPDG